MIEDRHRQFLVEVVHADAVRHSGRTLLTHLVGTHGLLEKWGANQDVCLGGLFHSIYGTRRFRHESWPLDRRARIVGLIGPRAEHMAYLFGVINRPGVLFDRTPNRTPQIPGSWYVHDTHKRAGLLLSIPLINNLREIEAANLLEQRSKGIWLNLLLREDISAGAKEAIRHAMAAAELPAGAHG